MKIKSRNLLLFAVFLAIVLVIVMVWQSKQEKYVDHTATNEGVVQTRSFSVKSDSTNLNTSANGTVFVWGDEGIAERMRIVASIEVDPNDWGGIAFYIPQKWFISNIINSYPDNQLNSKPSEQVSTAIIGENKTREWRTWIEVGRDHSHKPTGGGTGTVIIDLVSDKKSIQPSDTFLITVAVGADDKNGVKRMELDSIKIPISLVDNETQ